MALPTSADDAEAVEIGHLEVEQDQIGARARGWLATASLPVPHARDHFDVGSADEQLHQTFARDRLVLDDQRSNPIPCWRDYRVHELRVVKARTSRITPQRQPVQSLRPRSGA